ncbi:hypothetical protein [Sphingomonas palmae]|uniref:hypothetical protein n=1 Tax=Sphingomonas palmae TaxID=1855283 RepID=UPI00115FD792|nr:hypothetical protein [Sphingomonas palmae]
MLRSLLDIACGQRAEVRALASTYVARYGPDALALARMARADLLERGRCARAALYDQAIDLLALRIVDHHQARRAPFKLRMTISDMSQVMPRHQHRCSQQRTLKLLQMSPT